MKLFVWDFHGVLEKGTEHAVLEISNKALSNLGYSERFTIGDVKRLYGLKWWEFFKDLLPKESDENCRLLQKECLRIDALDHSIIKKHTKVNDYAFNVLNEINKKHEQVLISNTNPDALNLFLETTGLIDLFKKSHIIGVDAHKNGSGNKLDCLREFLQGKNFEELIIIGDSIGDMMLKKVNGGKTYLYSHPWKNFVDCDSDFKINDLRNVLDEL